MGTAADHLGFLAAALALAFGNTLQCRGESCFFLLQQGAKRPALGLVGFDDEQLLKMLDIEPRYESIHRRSSAVGTCSNPVLAVMPIAEW